MIKYKQIQVLDKLIEYFNDNHNDNIELGCNSKTVCACNARCACNTQRTFAEYEDEIYLSNTEKRVV